MSEASRTPPGATPERPARVRHRPAATTHVQATQGQPPPALPTATLPPPHIVDKMVDARDDYVAMTMLMDFQNGAERDLYGLSNDNLGSRMRQLHDIDPAVAHQNILKALNLMVLRRYGVDQMATAFNVSIRTIHRWLADLREAKRREGALLDRTPLIGETLQVYAFVRAQAMDMAMHVNSSPHVKLRAMGVMMMAEDRLVRTYSNSWKDIRGDGPGASAPADGAIAKLHAGLHRVAAALSDERLVAEAPPEDIYVDESGRIAQDPLETRPEELEDDSDDGVYP